MYYLQLRVLRAFVFFVDRLASLMNVLDKPHNKRYDFLRIQVDFMIEIGFFYGFYYGKRDQLGITAR